MKKSINQALDMGALSEAFRLKRRLQVPDFFSAETADYLYQLLLNNKTWCLTYDEGEENYASSLEEFQTLELGEQPGHPMHQMQEFMNRDSTLSFIRTLTGQDDIRRADSYASWYARITS
ncbi:MAG: hypothetical protein O7F73_14420 [Gammaproteobacteria bacterium]|nr:hypothetical protein [Gammaproteobacteria bacterium]